ncbi:hypothetical protein Ab1vBOLIVR6_gp120 [Agrobacterium phage OLIVR6]|nr:hypothetical protein Ab1vBOLIVR6_gp120 [Agrobacterium phage OLIVR6]
MAINRCSRFYNYCDFSCSDVIRDIDRRST